MAQNQEVCFFVPSVSIGLCYVYLSQHLMQWHSN